VNGTNLGSQGHIEASPLFWGDLCRQKITYVRNFVLGDINTLKACPVMPYHDPARPYVKYWFASSEGGDVASFNAMLRENNQERLRREGGACIIYTHLAKGFVEKGRVDKRFRTLMERVARMDGWFVPVRTLLDFIVQIRGNHVITCAERNRLERRWLWYKIAQAHGRT
jgi:hypothetical protein